MTETQFRKAFVNLSPGNRLIIIAAMEALLKNRGVDPAKARPKR